MLMRKYILITILLIAALTIYGQAPHKSLYVCDYDTIEYVSYNFSENKARYIGQRVEKLLNELNFPIRFFHPLSPDSLPDTTQRDKINGLFIHYLSQDEIARYAKLNELEIGIRIHFEEPWIKEVTKFDSIQYDYGTGGGWRPEYFKLFKEYMVKDIDLIRSNEK